MYPPDYASASLGTPDCIHTERHRIARFAARRKGGDRSGIYQLALQ